MADQASLTVADWHRLNRLLEQGLEVEGVERSAWLDALGAQDQHLRAVLIDLLTQSDATGFATSVTHPPTAMANLAAQALAAMRRERPGDRIGPWQLTRLVAEGGMGAVWVAERADGVMKRTAALKLPRAEWIDQGLSERIARERAILARLQHPAIAVLYDAGVTVEGRPYLALEYVAGVAIDVYSKERDLTVILRLCVQVIRAVAYAHAQLVIHRDLKPANVLVTPDGSPKLLDFGISKLIEGDTPTVDATALTRLAGRPLTLAYAAPEQVLGLPITVAADVYALGVMLFELVTGARLYRAGDQRALEAELLGGNLRKPSESARDKHRAKALKGDLDAVIAKALKREPAERYQTAAALADDLERFLDGQPVQAQPDSRAYRLRKFVQRNVLPVAAGSAVLIALGVGLGVALWQADAARTQADVAREQAARATALNTFVLSLIQQADPRASQSSKAADLAMLTAIEQRIDTEFKGSPDQLVQLRVTVGDAYRERGKAAAARRVYRRAIAEAQTTLPANHLGLLKARVASANFVVADDEALQSLDATIEMLRQAGPAGIEPLVDALVARVASVRTFGRRPGMTWDSLYADAREAHDLTGRHFGAGSARQLRAAQSLSQTLTTEDNFRFDGESKRPIKDRAEEAFTVMESVLAAAGSNPAVAEGNVDLLIAEIQYGQLLCQFRSFDDGMRRLWDATGVARKHHSEDSTPLDLAYFHLGVCLATHRDPEGVWMLVNAYRLQVSREESSPWVLAHVASRVARMQCDAARGAECADFTAKALSHATAMTLGEIKSRALAYLRPPQVHALILQGRTEEAVALATAFLLEPHCCEQSLTNALGFALRLDGRFEEAARAADKAMSIHRTRGLAENHPFFLWPQMQRGLAELELQKPAQALASVEPAVPLAIEGPSWDVDWGVIHLAHGRALLANGRAAEALEPLRKAYGFWLGHDPKSVWTAEAEYWFGQAWIANGDVKRGRWMVAEAKRALAASPFKLHRALAAAPKP